MSIKLLGCMILAMSAATAATAADVPNPPSVEISFSDLDLTGAAGQAVLRHRIERAVERVCPRSTPFVPREEDETAQCRREALASASAAVSTAIAQAQQRSLAGRTQLAAH